jgi:hypothetical protein
MDMLKHYKPVTINVFGTIFHTATTNSESISFFWMKICDELKMPAEFAKLSLNGKNLLGEPWRRLDEFNVSPDKPLKITCRVLGGASNKRPRDNDNDGDKPSSSAQKGVPREDKLEDQERQLDKLVKELEEYISEDELLNNIVTQIKTDKETSKNSPTTCMSNVFKKLPYDMLEKLEDGKHTNIFLTAQQISKVIYKDHYKQIKDYEDIYATAKKLMEMQVLFAMLLQFHEDMFLERASMKTVIKQIKKDMNKAEGAAEANRMRD